MRWLYTKSFLQAQSDDDDAGDYVAVNMDSKEVFMEEFFKQARYNKNSNLSTIFLRCTILFWIHRLMIYGKW